MSSRTLNISDRIRQKNSAHVMTVTIATILPCFVPSATNRHCARIPRSKTLERHPMMMKDLREVPMPPAEMGSTSKIVALAIALVFGAIGAYSYETGTWNSQPKQIVASKEVPPPAPLGNAAPSEAAPPALADLPPAPAKNVPAQTSTQAAAAPPPVRVARAQTPAPALPQAQPRRSRLPRRRRKSLRRPRVFPNNLRRRR